MEERWKMNLLMKERRAAMDCWETLGRRVMKERVVEWWQGVATSGHSDDQVVGQPLGITGDGECCIQSCLTKSKS